MDDEDQECFEGALELEHFLTERQAGKVAHLPMELTPHLSRVHRMAMLFHAATSGESKPFVEFTAQARGARISLFSAKSTPHAVTFMVESALFP